jgi:hypothetical protein
LTKYFHKHRINYKKLSRKVTTMAPAVECSCGYTARTAHEPAAPGEMEKLFSKGTEHALTAYCRKILASLDGRKNDGHDPYIRLYEQTPDDKRFVQAEVVGEAIGVE